MSATDMLTSAGEPRRQREPGHTELGVAAFAVATLIVAGHTDATIDDLAAATGVPILWIRRAVREVRRDPWLYDPTDAIAKCAEPSLTDVEKSDDATQTCPECGEEKPAVAFPVRTDTNGTRRAWCGACLTELSRRRYVTVEQSERLGVFIRFVVHALDACVGDTCAECHREIHTGDEVEALDFEFRHVHCDAPTT